MVFSATAAKKLREKYLRKVPSDGVAGLQKYHRTGLPKYHRTGLPTGLPRDGVAKSTIGRGSGFCPVLTTWMALALALGAARISLAAPSLRVQSEGGCPSAEQVSVALDYLLKQSGDSAKTDAAAEAWTLVVTDLGQHYRVSLAGEVRAYEDFARDCEERARVAAVFAAITLEPPEVAERAKSPAPLPARRRQLELRLGGLAELGVERSDRTFIAGGELRGAWVGQILGMEIGAGAESPATLAWGDYRAQITRFPLDVGVRAVLRRTRAVASLSAGLAVTVFNLHGEGAALPVHDDGTRVDLGLRSAVSVLLLPAARFSPFLGLHVSVSPKPYAVVVDPVGQVGSTPQVWVGATLGIAVAAR